jgi:hypothetical protein
LPSCVRTSASPGPANATSKFEQTQVWRWLWHDKSRHWSPWENLHFVSQFSAKIAGVSFHLVSRQMSSPLESIFRKEPLDFICVTFGWICQCSQER